MSSMLLRFGILQCALLGLVGCSALRSVDMLPDRAVDYKKEKSVDANLEIPPDLTKSSMTDVMEIPEAGGEPTTYSQLASVRRPGLRGGAESHAVLPDIENIELKRDGDKRWLEIRAQADALWPKVVSFWKDSGILLVQEDPLLGIMETGWIENRADIKSDFLTDTLRGVLPGLYSAATRDQYRVRLEKGQNTAVTELYLTHRGMLQKITSSNEAERPVWEIRPSDPELEAEMLRRLVVYLGVSDQKAAKVLAQQRERPAVAQLVKDKDGTTMLIIGEGFDRAWRQVGVALDRVGFVVEDRDRSKGLYYVKYKDPMKLQEKGILSRLAFWSDDKKADSGEFQINLIADGGLKTRVLVADKTGKREDSSTATRILTLLQEQMR